MLFMSLDLSLAPLRSVHRVRSLQGRRGLAHAPHNPNEAVPPWPHNRASLGAASATSARQPDLHSVPTCCPPCSIVHS
jgi:hypothetical protein